MDVQHCVSEEDEIMHQKNLAHLCRICPKLVGKKKYEVKKYENGIENCFNINISLDKDTCHPKYMCQNCYLLMYMSKKRNTTTKLEPCNNWSPHSSNCQVCRTVPELKKGIIGSQKILKKKITAGRPKATGSNTWSQTSLNLLKQNIPSDEFPSQLLLKHFNADTNPHLQLCVCGVCKDIIRKPLIINSCEHAFCFSCLAIKIKSKDEKECFCPVCNTQFNKNELSFSKSIYNMLMTLTLSCTKCHKKYNPIQEFKQFCLHEKECSFTNSNSSSTLSVTDIFHLSEETELPRIVEDATLHVIRTKISKSKLPNNAIAFKTEGPRVSSKNKYFAFNTTEWTKSIFLQKQFCLVGLLLNVSLDIFS